MVMDEGTLKTPIPKRRQREGRGATVHMYSSFVHGCNSSQAGSKIPTMSECISSLQNTLNTCRKVH
jgi:hypothetical protein